MQYSRAEALNECGGFVSATPSQDPIFNKTTGTRDRDKKVVGNYLLEGVRTLPLFVVYISQLRFASESLVERINGHFPWGLWCEFAFRHKVMLSGWPRIVMVPGPGFSHKNSVSTDGWRELAARVPAIWRNNPLRNPKLPEIDIVPWPESTCFLFCIHVSPD